MKTFRQIPSSAAFLIATLVPLSGLGSPFLTEQADRPDRAIPIERVIRHHSCIKTAGKKKSEPSNLPQIADLASQLLMDQDATTDTFFEFMNSVRFPTAKVNAEKVKEELRYRGLLNSENQVVQEHFEAYLKNAIEWSSAETKANYPEYLVHNSFYSGLKRFRIETVSEKKVWREKFQSTLRQIIELGRKFENEGLITSTGKLKKQIPSPLLEEWESAENSISALEDEVISQFNKSVLAAKVTLAELKLYFPNLLQNTTAADAVIRRVENNLLKLLTETLRSTETRFDDLAKLYARFPDTASTTIQRGDVGLSTLFDKEWDRETLRELHNSISELKQDNLNASALADYQLQYQSSKILKQ